MAIKLAAQLLSVAGIFVPLCSASAFDQVSLQAGPVSIAAVRDTSLDAAKALDTDKSGKVELAEVESFARMHGLDVDAVSAEFGTFDQNKDGSLDVEELNATLAGLALDASKPKASPEAIAKPAAVNQVSLQSGQQKSANAAASAAGTAPEGTVESMIKALDSDGSGKVEEKEIEAFAKSQGLSPDQTKTEFKDLDKNGDGELDPAEIKNTVASDAAPEKKAPAPAPASAKKETVAETVPAAVKQMAESAKEAMAAKPPVQVVPAKQELPNVNLEKILNSNMVQADQSVARLFASKAASELASRNKDVEEAKGLEKVAFTLRAKAAKVAANAVAKAEAAAQAAGKGIIQAALGQAEKLRKQAKEIEDKASAVSSRAKTAMSAAMNAQQAASKEVNKLVQLEATDAAKTAAAALQQTVKATL